MRISFGLSTLIALALLTSLSVRVTFAQAAVYEIRFTGTWDQNDATAFPNSAHFTELVGATHKQGRQFWENGAKASAGIEEIAETGGSLTFSRELARLQQNGAAGSLITFDSLFGLPGASSTRRIDVDQSKPFITLISMIAPSPDWFVGVSGLPLQSNGQWLQNLRLELTPYDAGTEAGNGFSLSNSATSPTQAISRLENSPFFGRPSLGILEFTLISPIQATPVDSPPEDPISGSNVALPLATVISLILNSK